MIKILIDSASDISQEEASKYGIEVIPLIVNFGDEQFLDGVNLTPKQFYEKLIETDTLPKTSQITPFRFEETYERLVSEGYDVIVITLSSKLSNTYNSALLASQEFENKVYVIDSLTVTAGERILCEYALKLIKDGLEIKEIVDKLNKVKERIRLIAVVDTLEYLKKGGRISKTVAFAGELLNIKPVISIENGEVKLVGKARGSKKANNLLNEIINQKGEIDFKLPYTTVYSGLSDIMLKKYIEDQKNLWESSANIIPIYTVGSTIGTHVGPGAIGVAFFSK
ncbi:MAG: DegV family protein [Acholeplasmatales bacterium]|nr:DegV family protein [Acholeplasmatales bacterium]